MGGLLGADYAGSANLGVTDLVLALRWVRANIAGFGGDPRRVTIAGRSAGGKNVGTLIGMPMADGLYARAALFSSGAQTVHNRMEQKILPASMRKSWAVRTNCSRRWIISLPRNHRQNRHGRNFPFRPMVDGHPCRSHSTGSRRQRHRRSRC
jgi:para-nitrobenzyl esterase